MSKRKERKKERNKERKKPTKQGTNEGRKEREREKKEKKFRESKCGVADSMPLSEVAQCMRLFDTKLDD